MIQLSYIAKVCLACGCEWDVKVFVLLMDCKNRVCINFRGRVELLDPNTFLGSCAPKPSVLSLDQMLLLWQKKDPDIMRYNIRMNPNVGSSFFAFRTHPKWVVRSAQLSDNESCYKYLISQYDIRNAINLYNHSFQSPDQVEK